MLSPDQRNEDFASQKFFTKNLKRQEIAQLVQSSMANNPNAKISKLSNEAWIDRNIFGRTPPNLLSNEAWQTFSKALRFSRVDSKNRVLKILEHPAFSDCTLSSEQYKQLQQVLDSLAKHTSFPRIEAALSLPSFVNGAHHDGIEIVDRLLKASLNPRSQALDSSSFMNGITALGADVKVDGKDPSKRSQIARQHRPKYPKGCALKLLMDSAPSKTLESAIINNWQNIKPEIHDNTGGLLRALKLSSYIEDLKVSYDKLQTLLEDNAIPFESVVRARLSHWEEIPRVTELLLEIAEPDYTEAERQLILKKLQRAEEIGLIEKQSELAYRYGASLLDHEHFFSNQLKEPLIDVLLEDIGETVATCPFPRLLALVQVVERLEKNELAITDRRTMGALVRIVTELGNKNIDVEFSEVLRVSAKNLAQETVEDIVQAPDNDFLQSVVNACNAKIELQSQLGTNDHISKHQLAKLAWHHGNLSDIAKNATHYKQALSWVLDNHQAPDIEEQILAWAKDSKFPTAELISILKIFAITWGGNFTDVDLYRENRKRATIHLDDDDFKSILGAVEQFDKRALIKEYRRRRQSLLKKQVRSYLVDYITTTDTDKKNAAASKINLIYTTDSGPYAIYKKDQKTLSPSYEKMLKEVLSIYRGCFDLHYGFSHLTYECRSLPTCKPWMLTRFGLDSGVKVSRVNHFDPTTAPGPGVLISGLQLHRLYSTNPETPEDPFSHIKQVWSWSANEFDDTAETSYLRLRTGYAVLAPKTEKYRLNSTHYSLLVRNDHILNPDKAGAALVPTSILEEKFAGKLLRVNKDGSINDSNSSISTDGRELDFEEIKSICRAKGLNFLDLTWASNLGGLCNAYPPKSEPYFGWEATIGKFHTKDNAGHVHKSHITGMYRRNMTLEMNQLLAPMREGHNKVYQLASAYLNLDDLFRLALSQWHKGFTISEASGDTVELVQEDQAMPDFAPNEMRMLEEAYRWHALHHKGIKDPEEFPVLCLPPVLDYWSMVDSPVYLDTFDLSLRAPGYSGKLSSDIAVPGGFEATIWKNYVRPQYYNRSDLDLRFLHRALLKTF